MLVERGDSEGLLILWIWLANWEVMDLDENRGFESFSSSLDILSDKSMRDWLRIYVS